MYSQPPLSPNGPIPQWSNVGSPPRTPPSPYEHPVSPASVSGHYYSNEAIRSPDSTFSYDGVKHSPPQSSRVDRSGTVKALSLWDQAAAGPPPAQPDLSDAHQRELDLLMVAKFRAERVRQERYRVSGLRAGKEKLAETSRKIPKKDPKEFAAMAEMKCQMHFQMEKEAQRKALKMLNEGFIM